MSLLGIDIGTSGCKSAVFSETGELLNLAYEEYDYRRPQPGWAELDVQDTWKKIQQTIQRAAAGEAVAHDPIQAVCVSSLGEAVVPVTMQREILGAALLNFDTRGDEYLAGLRGSIAAERFYEINGNTIGSPYTLTKLKWVKEHQPELYERADVFLHFSGFVAFILGAEPCVDYSLANRTLLFGLEKRDWDDELLRWAQLDREKLPCTVAAGQVIGRVRRDCAIELGLPAGIPIVSGAHDQCCNGVGVGAIHPGKALYGLGTYLCMMPVFTQRPEPKAMMTQGLNTEHHAVPGQYVSFIYNQGGSLVKWFRDTFAAAERRQSAEIGFDLYQALLQEMPSGPSRVMALPHFTVTGPPNFIGDSCGVLAGLHLDTSRGEILKGLIEATTYYLRECSESLPQEIAIKEFRAAGGGSKSEAWLQICADILGQPFLRPKVSEAGALGAAILAGVGSGVYSSIEAGVEAMVHFDREIHPRPEMQRRYGERFEKYRRLWPLMSDYLRDLAE